MIEKFNDVYIWILFIILLINMSQRRIKGTYYKSKAIIYIALLSLLTYLGVIIIDVKELSGWFIIVPIVISIIIGIIFRNKIWPFRLHCKKCKKRLSYEYIIGHDDCLCQDCHELEHPEEKAERERKEREKANRENPELLQTSFMEAEKIDDINWDLWEPTDRCVITFTQENNKILFIEKKRGLGEGYYNAPGGHIELEKTASEAAIRETKEETGLDIKEPKLMGTIYFQFKHKDIRELGYVFTSYGAEGELKECEEARPFWIDKDKIPYENMWEDDVLWLPGMLEGKKFEAYFLLDDRKLVDHKVIWLSEE